MEGPTPGAIARLLHNHPINAGTRLLLLSDGLTTEQRNRGCFRVTDGELVMDMRPDSCYDKYLLRVNDVDYVVGKRENTGGFFIGGVRQVSEDEKRVEACASLSLRAGALLELCPVFGASAGSLLCLTKIIQTDLPSAKEYARLRSVDKRENVQEPDLPLPTDWKLEGGTIERWFKKKNSEYAGQGVHWKRGNFPPSQYSVLQLIKRQEVEENKFDVWLSDGVYYRVLSVKEKVHDMYRLSTVPVKAVLYSNLCGVLPVMFGTPEDLTFRILFVPSEIIGTPLNVNRLNRRRQNVPNDDSGEEAGEPIEFLEELNLPDHLVARLRDSKSWGRLLHAYGKAKHTPHDLVYVIRGSDYGVDQFAMSCVHQGSLYSATVASIDVLVDALPFCKDPKKAALCLDMISESAFNRNEDLETFDFDAPTFPWEVPRCCVVAGEKPPYLGLLPRDILLLWMSYLDAAALVALSKTCKYLCHESFAARETFRKIDLRCRVDDSFACACKIKEKVPDIMAYLQSNSVVDELWCVMSRTRVPGLCHLAVSVVRSALSPESTRVSAALYLGAIAGNDMIDFSEVPFMVAVAFAYARCAAGKGDAKALETLVGAWKNHGQELDSAEEHYAFLRECWTYQWKFAFARVMCKTAEGTLSYLPFLATCPPLQTNIDTILSAPMSSAFKKRYQSGDTLSQFQKLVLTAVMDFVSGLP